MIRSGGAIRVTLKREKPAGSAGFSSVSKMKIPATSYSPTKSPWQYHRRWRA
jgi:hypothetical protein